MWCRNSHHIDGRLETPDCALRLVYVTLRLEPLHRTLRRYDTVVADEVGLLLLLNNAVCCLGFERVTVTVYG